MPRNITFSDGETLQGFGRGRPDPNEFSSTVNDILDNPGYVSTEQGEKIQKVISSYNQKAHEINRLRSSVFEVNRNKRLHKLTQEAKQDIKYLGVLNDYESTFNYWSKDLNSFLKSEFGGRVPPDIQSYVLNVKSQIEDKQIRILWNENQKGAFDVLSDMSSTFRQNLFDGDASSAARNYQQLVGTLNSFEETGVFDKELIKNLRQGYERTYNDIAAGAIMDRADRIEVTHGFSHKKAYLDKTSNFVDTNKASPKVSKIYDQYKKSVDDGEIDFAKKARNVDQLKDTYIRVGQGNPLAIKAEANSFIKAAEGKLKEFSPASPQYAGLKSTINEMKAYTKIISAFQDISQKGNISSFIDMVKPLGAKQAREMFDKLNITDPEEQDLFVRQHGAMTARYNYDKDPIGAINKIVNEFRDASSDSELVKRQDPVSKYQEEFRNVAFVTGKGNISEESKTEIAKILNAVPTTPEDQALQDDVQAWLSSNNVSMAQMMKDSQHPTVGSQGLKFVTDHAGAFTYLKPDTESWTQIKQNFKSPNFKTGVDNVRKYYTDNFFEEMKELANTTGTTIENIANTMSLNVVQGLTKGSRGGPLGPRGVQAVSDGIFGDDEDALNDLFQDMRQGVLDGYSTRSEGATSFLNTGVFADYLKKEKPSAQLFSELLTGKSERANIALGQSPLSGTAIIGPQPKIAKADKVKFYKGLSDLTGLNTEDFTNRVAIKQSQTDQNYYLFLSTPHGGQVALEYKASFPFKGRIKISEDEMREFLNLDLNEKNIVPKLFEHILRTP